MPIYTFELHDGDHRVEDQTGVGLPDRARALAYAHDVARELMRHAASYAKRLLVKQRGPRRLRSFNRRRAGVRDKSDGTMFSNCSIIANQVTGLVRAQCRLPIPTTARPE